MAIYNRRTILPILVTGNVAILGAPTSISGQVLGSSNVVKIARVNHAPIFEDFLSMAPSLDATFGMTKIEELVQRTPSEGTLVSERTVVYLGYDNKGIYAVFLCFDRTPSKPVVRENLLPIALLDSIRGMQTISTRSWHTFRGARSSRVWTSKAPMPDTSVPSTAIFG